MDIKTLTDDLEFLGAEMRHTYTKYHKGIPAEEHKRDMEGCYAMYRRILEKLSKVQK